LKMSTFYQTEDEVEHHPRKFVMESNLQTPVTNFNSKFIDFHDSRAQAQKLIEMATSSQYMNCSASDIGR